MQATYFRQQSASKCLNAGSSEVNCLNATLVVGHRDSVAAKEMVFFGLFNLSFTKKSSFFITSSGIFDKIFTDFRVYV